MLGICADLSESTRFEGFQEGASRAVYRDRRFRADAGRDGRRLAAVGKIPWIASYAMFNPGRSWEQVRTIMALNETNVKIAGAHAGVSVGPDGATHQAIEDIAIMRVIPHMTVVVPCDSVQTKKATLALSRDGGPVYLRFGREKSAVVTTESTPFEIGKAQTFREGGDVAIVACGILVYNALIAADDSPRTASKPRRQQPHRQADGRGRDRRRRPSELRRDRDRGRASDARRHGFARRGDPGGKSIRCRSSSSACKTIRSIGDPVELIEHYGMGIDAIEAAARRALKRK